MATKFIFFDLGNVLLRFSTERLICQAADLIACDPDRIVKTIYQNGLQRRFECGRISEQEFYDTFCRELDCRPPLDQLKEALSDIFWVLEETQPIAEHLAVKGFPRGILSNVGVAHWTFCMRKFPDLFKLFPDNHILSFQVGIMKPDARIYAAAWEVAARTVPEIQKNEILFIDDLEPNILGAKEFGLDAVQFVGGRRLAEDLQQRKVMRS